LNCLDQKKNLIVDGEQLEVSFSSALNSP